MCGICKYFGHGQIECKNSQLKNKLIKYNNDTMLPQHRCTFDNCKYNYNHNNDAHHCHKCLRKHSPDECIIQDYQIHFNRFSIDNIDIDQLKNNNNSYAKIYAGMGCDLYIRNKNNKISSLFMHSDSWGQYGPDTSDLDIYERFILNITEIDINILKINQNVDFECPICRTINNKNKVLEIKGSEEQCKICMDNKVEIYFIECKHTIICKPCLKKL
jgi:hypothetical protein